jgi:catechol 2,3-dioxygenase-like lactoylglutathione lyase family enzyme
MAKNIVYQLHHFGLLCQDMEKSSATYQNQLGMQLTSRYFNRGYLDISFFGRGSDATLELVSKPFMPYEEEYIAQYGHRMNHMSFLVEDAAAAFEDLVKKGVKVAWEPQKVLDLWQCGFYDDDGLLFEVFSPLDPAAPMATSDLPCGPGDLCLDHISILTPDLKRSQKFYSEKLGLKTVLEYLPGGGGFIFMVDPCYDAKKHIFKLEIIGPPGLEPREDVLISRHGACFDHLAFVTEDVRAAWELTLQRGARNMEAPVQGYGVWMAWVNDPDGNDIEIMNSFREDRVMEAVRSGVPVIVS